MRKQTLKVFGALLSAALMASAIAVVSASATAGGAHFTSEEAHTILKGSQDTTVGAKRLEFHAAIGSLHCSEMTFEGTATSATQESGTNAPLFGTTCTPAGSTNTVHVNLNGCTFTFTIRTNPETNHNTTHLVCPPEKTVTLIVTLEHSNVTACTIHIAPQTPAGGIIYGTKGSGSTHAITARITLTGITVTRTPNFFGGCLFAPETGHEAELTGDAVITGFNTAGEQVGITAT